VPFDPPWRGADHRKRTTVENKAAPSSLL